MKKTQYFKVFSFIPLESSLLLASRVSTLLKSLTQLNIEMQAAIKNSCESCGVIQKSDVQGVAERMKRRKTFFFARYLLLLLHTRKHSLARLKKNFSHIFQKYEFYLQFFIRQRKNCICMQSPRKRREKLVKKKKKVKLNAWRLKLPNKHQNVRTSSGNKSTHSKLFKYDRRK